MKIKGKLNGDDFEFVNNDYEFNEFIEKLKSQLSLREGFLIYFEDIDKDII